MNISGVVVRTAPENLQSVMDGLRSSGLCEVHFHDGTGRIIVTVEGENTSEEVTKVKTILNMPYVLCADLAYTCSEEETGESLDKLKSVLDPVPDVLKSQAIEKKVRE
jgi:nitrate reductase NapD